nr:hypothetical protein [Bacteroidota bacterium]
MAEKFQNKYRIPSNRWQFWDYSAPGDYFITININHRIHLLGSVNNGEMHLSECGEIVKTEFLQIPKYHCRVILDEWVIMPNHVHCIITLGDYNHHNGKSSIGETDETSVGDLPGGDRIRARKIHEFSQQEQPPTEQEIKQYRALRRKMIIPKLLGKCQMLTSKQINIIQNTPGYKNWQPNYHDHVIRNDEEYKRIKQYIINNPKKWDK